MVGKECDENYDTVSIKKFIKIIGLNLPVNTVATAYGMTDHNCTLLAFVVKPESLMMVGRNRPNEYSPDRMAKYADAESHILMSITPRMTSDHLKDSCSTLVSLVHTSICFNNKEAAYLASSS